MSFVLNWIYENAWGITPLALEAIIKIADKEKDIASKKMIDEGLSEIFHKSALSMKGGQAIAGTRYSYIRDGVGVIQVTGPIFPRANLMTEMSGATSIQALSLDFSALLDNQEISAILFDIDSPGGAITGVSEFSQFVAQNRNIKPVHAFISGAGASAAYWIASAASRVAIADTGEAGSIGVVALYRDTQKKDEREGVKNLEIVSSQSPLKRVGPDTDEGRAKIQRLVDSAASVFIQKVADYRGTDEETVLEEFGRGDMFIGVNAFSRGLVDSVSTFEDEISIMSKSKTKRKGFIMSKAPEQQAGESVVVTYTVEGVKEGSPETYDAIFAAGRKEGIDFERARIVSILGLATPGCETLISEAVKNSDMTAEKVAIEIVKQQKVLREKQTAELQTSARALADQATSIGAGVLAGTEDEAKTAQRASVIESMKKGGNAARK